MLGIVGGLSSLDEINRQSSDTNDEEQPHNYASSNNLDVAVDFLLRELSIEVVGADNLILGGITRAPPVSDLDRNVLANGGFASLALRQGMDVRGLG